MSACAIRLKQVGLVRVTKSLHFCKHAEYAPICFFILFCSSEMLITYASSPKYS